MKDESLSLRDGAVVAASRPWGVLAPALCPALPCEPLTCSPLGAVSAASHSAPVASSLGPCFGPRIWQLRSFIRCPNLDACQQPGAWVPLPVWA